VTPTRTIRIGGAGAGYGDGTMATPRLIRDGALDYIMLDFLSEYFMPQAGRARAQDSQAGYVMYFPGELFANVLPDLLERKVRMVTNAGAVNPQACAAAMREAAAALGLNPRIAVVDGDDLLGEAEALRASGKLRERIPEGTSYTGINAYLGAFPIARALDLGADIVITGRVVDSALALGPLIHEFGWGANDYDLLAAGSLIGHLLECGAQASGGIFTDWNEVADYSDIGYPIAECHADGTAVITKPEGTGGLVSIGTVAEQLLYEIGDPRSYRLPDVVVDFDAVHFTQQGKDRVLVAGAKGRPPSGQYKAIATWDDGWLASWGFAMRGPQAGEKARAIAESVFKRGGRMLAERNLPPLRRSRIEVIGDEESYGDNARSQPSREVFCRMAIEAEEPDTFALLMKEMGTGSVSMAPGIAGSLLMFPPTPAARSEAFLIPATEVTARVTLDGQTHEVAQYRHDPPHADPAPASPPPITLVADTVVPLSRLAWVRSGDKGDTCNVGVIARKAEYLPYLAAALDETAVASVYGFMFGEAGEVERFTLPGCNALNFLLKGALDGGCTVSLRFDPFGKSAAQDALDVAIPIASRVLAAAAARDAAPAVLRPLAPFGVEIACDLSRPLGESGRSVLRALLDTHGLLVLRGQSLGEAAHTALMESFGPVLVEEGGHRMIAADGNLGSGRLLFHSDLAFTAEPFRVLSLLALDLTEGTETWFSSGTHAYETLPEALRARIAGLDATSAIPPSQGERLVGHATPAFGPQFRRPVIFPHPGTGRPILFVSEQQTARIEGLAAADSDVLLGELFDHLYAPANVYRHRWRNGDLVIWDNIALQHARPDQSATPRRRLRRVAVAEKTFFQLCPQFPPDDPRIAAWGVGGRLDLAQQTTS
jgi:alpha-ketoglutarate-dependent taurine dioxygenase